MAAGYGPGGGQWLNFKPRRTCEESHHCVVTGAWPEAPQSERNDSL
jgi:hypothetical protein